MSLYLMKALRFCLLAVVMLLIHHRGSPFRRGVTEYVIAYRLLLIVSH